MKLRPKGMSIDKCAALVGVSRGTIIKIESDHEHVKFGTVKKYCEVCGYELPCPFVPVRESPCESNDT
jgi:DNA-binding XRE family transcriptional regulator